MGVIWESEANTKLLYTKPLLSKCQPRPHMVAPVFAKEALAKNLLVDSPGLS